MRPLLFAAPLGGARGHDDDVIQANSLRDEWSVDSWTAGDRYGTSCAQLDNFDWVMPAGYPVGVLPRLKEDDSLSDIEPDVCDVPNVFPVRRETAAAELLCFPVVVPTRPQGGCDPVLPLPMGRGRDFLAVDDPEVIVCGRSPTLQNQMSVVRSVWYRISFRLLCLYSPRDRSNLFVLNRQKVGWWFLK